MITGISFATRQYEHQRNLTAAIAVAESVMEQIVLLPQSHPTLTSGNIASRYYDVDGNDLGPSGASHPNMVFTGRWTAVGDTPITGLREVTLTITWNESVGVRRLELKSVRP